MNGQAVAVTVVGGYLGAGKTTLVNHLLSVADERVAVLVNDFGAINIDAALIESTDGNTMTLSNGCICCSLVDGLAVALATITSLEPRPDRLIIEASGVADPGAVAAYAHAPGLTLDAVVVVVDAEALPNQATDRYVGDIVCQQLASADLLIVNKTDLVTAQELATLRTWLATRAPRAAVVETTRAVIPISVLSALEPMGFSRSGQHQPLEQDADDQFETWTWESSRPMSRATIDALMERLPLGVIRLKGTLALDDDPTGGWVLQRVGQRWSLEPGSHRPARSQLVAIAKKGAVDGDILADHFGP